jgi:hypothetical protein
MQTNRENFIRWYAWSLEYKDCDPAIWMTNYLNKRYEHNSEEKIWLCWLYANTYYLPTAWVLKNEFPDYELATIDRLTWWNTQNYKRLRYQTDTKYNKGHLPRMFESYQNFIGDELQKDILERYYGDNEYQNFHNLWNAINKNYHKFGRYTTWFYMQSLYHTAHINVVPDTLMLDDYSGSRSHRNGLVMALGKEDWYDSKLTKQEYASLQAAANDILVEMKIRFPFLRDQIDFYTMETCLCSFKKIFREHHGRYLGYYLDRQAEEIQQVEKDGWTGIEWNVLWQSREETLDKKLLTNKIDENKFASFLNSGRIDRLDWTFEDEKPVLEGLESLWD